MVNIAIPNGHCPFADTRGWAPPPAVLVGLYPVHPIVAVILFSLGPHTATFGVEIIFASFLV